MQQFAKVPAGKTQTELEGYRIPEHDRRHQPGNDGLPDQRPDARPRQRQHQTDRAADQQTADGTQRQGLELHVALVAAVGAAAKALMGRQNRHAAQYVDQFGLTEPPRDAPRADEHGDGR